MKQSREKFDVYDLITDKIIAQLEKGQIPWRKTWTVNNLPQNFISKKRYEGINFFLLSLITDQEGYRSGNFLTYNQAKAKGGQVRRGEKGYPVVFWKILEFTDKKRLTDGTIEEEITEVPILRYYTVFNVDQCEGIDLKIETRHNDPIADAMAIVNDYKDKPEIIHKGSVACYSPSLDKLTMPPLDSFESAEAYHATLFHELTHSTGHKNRLNRLTTDENTHFGSASYAKEELVAEMGSAFLCSQVGISTQLENAGAYIQNWLTALKNDKKLVIRAGSQAQKAVKYIRGDK